MRNTPLESNTRNWNLITGNIDLMISQKQALLPHHFIIPNESNDGACYNDEFNGNNQTLQDTFQTLGKVIIFYTCIELLDHQLWGGIEERI